MKHRPLVSFEVPGKPHPLERARHGNGETYDTPGNAAAKETIQWRAGWKREPFTGPVRISIRCYYRRANPSADVDNLAKTVLDACNKFIIKDDRQVMELYVAKFASQDEDFTKVLIEEILNDR